MKSAFSLDFITASAGAMGAASCVSFICALSRVRLLLLKHKIEKEAASFSPVPPIEHGQKQKKVHAAEVLTGREIGLILH